LDALAAICLDVVVHSFPEVVVGQLRARDAHHGEIAGEQSGPRQVIERGNQHASSEIAGRAEDDHDARVALLADARRRDRRLFR